MKVYAVITDKIPAHCNFCKFSMPSFPDSGWFCNTRELVDEDCNLRDEEHYKLDIDNMVRKKPDWCPLVSKQEMSNYLVADQYKRFDTLFDMIIGNIRESRE